MSDAARNRVSAIFREAGFELLMIDAKPGESLRVTVSPDIRTLAGQFSDKRKVVREIVEADKAGRRLEIRLHRGSSIDCDGVYLEMDFVMFARDRAREPYDKAQAAVDAMFVAQGRQTVYPVMAEEFPGFDQSTLPAIPPDWKEASDGNDVCPSFEPRAGAQVFIDFADPSVRSSAFDARFRICLDTDDAGSAEAWRESDDWSEILALAENAPVAPHPSR